MKKFSDFLKKYKVLVIVFSVAILLLTIEVFFIHNKVKSKDTKKNTEKIESTENLSKKKKKVLGIDDTGTGSSDTISNERMQEKIEEQKEKIEESKKSDAYKKYEQLSEEEKSKLEVIPSKENVNIDVLDDIKNDDNYKDLDNIPSKYNLNDVIKLNFKNQGSYGLCWDFAGMKTIETYLQLHNLGEYDFSELVVDYMMSENLYGIRQLHGGGRYDDFLKYSTINEGFVETSKMPNTDYYYEYTKEEYSKFWNLEKQPFVVTEYIKFPTITKYDGKYIKYDVDYEEVEVTEEEMTEIRNLMKKHIMTNGALYMTHNSDYFDSEGSFYCNNNCLISNHAMAIVGWDDNYPKEKIIEYSEKENGDDVYVDKTNNHPTRDGAFIIVNSWGNDEEYFYISYEDGFIYQNLNGVKSTSFDSSLNLDNLSDNLKEYLKGKYKQYIVNYENNEYIPRAITSIESSLKLNNLGLVDSDLKVLDYFDNLYSLELNGNNITSLENLPEIKGLAILSINDNNISDVTILNNYQELVSLQAANNNIGDIGVLKDSEITDYLLDGNKNITGYNELFSGGKLLDDDIMLSLKDCNITEFSNNNVKYELLDLSSNPNLQILENIKVNSLYMNNNNLNTLELLDNVDENLTLISLTDNDIKVVEPLTKFNNILSVDLSGNKNIEDFEQLKKIYTEEKLEQGNNEVSYNMYDSLQILAKMIFDEEQEDIKNYFYDAPYMSLTLDDCNIDDVLVLKDIYISDLSLKNNNIKSIKGLNMKYLSSIDLSGNKLEDDSYIEIFKNDVAQIYLSDCGITNLNELNEVNSDDSFIDILDLSNNDIKDVTPLSKYEIGTLSFAKNKNLSGKLPESVSELNLSDCYLKDDTFNISELSNSSILNLSNNQEFTKYSELIKFNKINVLYVYNNNINLSDIEDNLIYYNSEDPDIKYYLHIYGDIIVDDYVIDNNIIDLLSKKKLGEFFQHEIIHQFENNQETNCTMDKYVTQITLNDNPDTCEITGYTQSISSSYSMDRVKYIFKVN